MNAKNSEVAIESLEIHLQVTLPVRIEHNDAATDLIIRQSLRLPVDMLLEP